MREIDLRVTVDEANVILEALGQQPFARVFALVAKIQQQASEQLVGNEAVTHPAEPDGDDSDGQ